MVGTISRCIGSLAVIRYFLPFMRPLPPTWRMAALGAALVVLSGCSTLEVKYEAVTQTDFSARSQPAKISNESELSLIERGYAKIGTVQANTETETDPTPVVLEKAASKGGDLVVLYRNNESRTKGKHTRRCARWGYVTYAYREWACVEWRSVYAGAVHTRHSAGTVWRYDLVLAKQAKQVQLGKEFFLAASRGDLRVVQDGLAQGLSPNAPNLEGRPLLVVAAESGQLAVVKLLIEKGADVNPRSLGTTALGEAARNGHTETVNHLLDNGADVNAKGEVGITALMIAAVRGQTGTVRALLARGADVNAKDKDGYSVLSYAATWTEHAETVEALLTAGADVNARSRRGGTPLMDAAGKGRTETVKLLLARGADMNWKDEDGLTALTHATKKGHTAVVKLLKQAGAKE